MAPDARADEQVRPRSAPGQLRDQDRQDAGLIGAARPAAGGHQTDALRRSQLLD